MKARFVAVEGIDGAGTTTLSRSLVEVLRARRIEAHWTCEPSQGPVGALLRRLLRGEEQLPGGATAVAMALLFAADRLDHLAGEIEPALAAGTWVVTDRYYYSTLAYQGEGDLFDWIRVIHRGARVPDLTILVDLPADVAADRRHGDGTRAGDELYDVSSVQREVAKRYRAALARLAEPAVVIDGTEDRDAVLSQAVQALERLMS